MKFVQKVGPFTSNEIIFNEEGVTYLQIGIEYPQSIPISEYALDEEFNDQTKIKIQYTVGQFWREFLITEKDMFEVSLVASKVNVVVLQNKNPYIIINVAYDIES